MKRISAGSFFALLALTVGIARAQADKPLAPGWLSLDGSVGLIDNKIGGGKSALRHHL